ncbi:MAG: signal peptidase I [Epulopiscium sp.]|nr:signal peptidase I [Candidatus Epulonipiscium sp.]
MSKMFKEWCKDAMLAVIIVLILYFFLWPMSIEGDSMERSFFAGDKVLISKVLTMAGKYQVGDIIVFRGNDRGKDIQMIKRVIAVSGQKVEINNGKVYIDGVLQQETYVEGTTKGNVNMIVPEGEIFFMGDNREFSCDSRDMGTISTKKLRGKVVLRWFPFTKITLY